jgi:hypothetical protein
MRVNGKNGIEPIFVVFQYEMQRIEIEFTELSFICLESFLFPPYFIFFYWIFLLSIAQVSFQKLLHWYIPCLCFIMHLPVEA